MKGPIGGQKFEIIFFTTYVYFYVQLFCVGNRLGYLKRYRTWKMVRRAEYV